MARAGGKGAIGRRIDRFQSAASRQALRSGQHFRRPGRCLP
jgi:hypothetical protein